MLEERTMVAASRTWLFALLLLALTGCATAFEPKRLAAPDDLRALEAVLCGTPIIVSSNSGAGEDVRRINAGYLVEWGNKSDLVDKIQYVLDNPDQAGIKTQKARDYLERNQSMSSRIIEYEELYARCIKEKGRRQ